MRRFPDECPAFEIVRPYLTLGIGHGRREDIYPIGAILEGTFWVEDSGRVDLALWIIGPDNSMRWIDPECVRPLTRSARERLALVKP